ncbi:MAG: A/G-specific adenine glycosylase [Undibacterium sp.]|nr:A/G-specific adenine glycosylase [Undibacterium sp.]
MNKIKNINQFQQNSPYYDPSFSKRIITWQKQFGRHHLPWQQSRDAYRVWLSEIMLQQTQVTAVIPYYQKFLERFPSVESLAEAPSEAVMALWSGLGYYTRARNLHQCARQVVAQYQAQFPVDPKLLQDLPGIGRSTAAAITAFSYGTRAAILDGNVKRVFTRVFGVEGYPGIKQIEDALWLRAEALLPEQEIQAYTQGLMDLGASLCSRSKPNCAACPLQKICVAHATARTAELPTKKPKKIQKEKHAVMLALVHAGQVLLEQRPNSGIWGGLLSLPEMEGMQMNLSEKLLKTEAQIQVASQYAQKFGEVEQVTLLSPISHVFTHFKLHMHVVQVNISERIATVAQPRYVWLPLSTVADAALPAPIKSLLSGF